MSKSYDKSDSDDDAFESADEGDLISSETGTMDSSNRRYSRENEIILTSSEPITEVMTTSAVNLDEFPILTDEEQHPTKPIIEGWDDWNIDDEPLNEEISTLTINKSVPLDSASSLSSSPSKNTDNTSHLASDEDEQREISQAQQSQKKKLRKKSIEMLTTTSTIKDDTKPTTTRPSRSTERRDHESHETDDTVNKKHSVQDAHRVLDRLVAQSPTRTPTWSNPWSNIGSFLSNAKQSVTTLTATVSEGLSAVMETVEAGLGAPDPQKLAEMNRMAFEIKGETSESEDEPESSTLPTENIEPVINQDGWLNALSLDKLTTTGMKVVSGSLDVLESVGKKTFDVLNEADPELKGTRRLLAQHKQPTLSEIIREAQNNNKSPGATTKTESATFFQLFEKHQGLAHFEALELLSNQSSLILSTMGTGNADLLEQIDSYFELTDDDMLNNDGDDVSESQNDVDYYPIPTLDVLSQKFTGYQSQLRSTVPVDKLLEVYESANQFLKEWDWMDTELDQKTLADEAIDSLAILCARIIEYYRKTAELFLIGCKSLTSFSIDIELLAIYKKQQEDFSNMLGGIPHIFSRSMKQISNLPTSTGNTNEIPVRCDAKFKQQLLNQMFIQSSSSQTYAADSYLLLKPIITQSILYHTSTTR